VARHLLVTNDYPPKTGGIQSYLRELWSRLPEGEAVVLTARGSSSRSETELFDAGEPYRVIRTSTPVLLPTPALRRRILDLVEGTGVSLVMIDPALPLGTLGPTLDVPYGLVLHGAEVTFPARLPVTRALLARVLAGASLVVAAGGYPEQEARLAAGDAMPPTLVCPPGVDVKRFRPLDPEERRLARQHFGLPPDGRLVVSVSRLVPRKGMDVLIEASALLGTARPDLTVAIAGEGRDRRRLERLVSRTGAPVRLLGRVPDQDLADLDACCDVWAMLCRNRWGGLEQEGFGIVFLEAAACGVPQVAGRSGGAGEAVENGETGYVVSRPSDPEAVAAAIGSLLDDGDLRARMGAAARRRVEAEFDYDHLAARLGEALASAAR
jgi:phosphatidylinositol alpha-1,6-mannosyltransferase